MPRDSSIVETAKQRSLRVPLDHYEQPDPLIRAKWWLTTVAVLLAAIYAAWLALGGRAALQQASPGPLAAAHAAWASDCQACHQDFQPLRGDALSLVGLVRGHKTNRETLDSSCIKCHDTPLHHRAAKPDEIPTCASCHREHRGATAAITRASDVACLNCHRDINGHRTGPSGLSPATGDVIRFASTTSDSQPQHPEFRSLTSDPGNIKFNHWLHLQPGIAVADAKKKLKLSDLDESLRAKYAAFVKGDEPLQLDCTACHQPDTSGGRSMQPIAYEQHCAACHPLQMSLAEGKPAIEVPHGLSADRLTTVLDGLLFAAERAQQLPQSLATDETGDLPLIPGKTLGKNLAQKISQDVLGRRVAAARAISTRCHECHYPREGGDTDTVVVALEPPQIPTVWFAHARFDHSAHRHIQCRQCHEAAYACEHRDKPQFINPPAGAAAARDDQQVMIAGMDSCAKCHAPARGGEGGPRHDCAECHTYHGGDAHAGVRSQESGVGSQEPGVSTQQTSPSLPLSLSPTLAPPLRLVSLVQSPRTVGASSCSSAGCHGDTRPDAPHWQTAFSIWAARDPHAQAYDVLWTHRGREMTRLLSRPPLPLGEGRGEGRGLPLTDAQHFAALQQRCLGCHSTPSDDSKNNHHDYTLGVHCESCHGPAEQWLHAHYRTGFDRNTPGFIDTKEFSQRARACMKCHVGPNETGPSPQVVDHDLIAAGHPRLNFEFHSYFESLPAHWNRQADERRHPGDFHAQSWRAGQAEIAKQSELLARNFPRDFAQLDCFSCHQQLKPSPHPRTSESASTSRYDMAVSTCLAARAQIADITREAHPQAARQIAAVNSALGELTNYLSRDCFPAEIRDRRLPTQYDSPTDFDPAVLASRRDRLLEALQALKELVPSVQIE
jgi:hypothetical protein